MTRQNQTSLICLQLAWHRNLELFVIINNDKTTPSPPPPTTTTAPPTTTTTAATTTATKTTPPSLTMLSTYSYCISYSARMFWSLFTSSIAISVAIKHGFPPVQPNPLIGCNPSRRKGRWEQVGTQNTLNIHNNPGVTFSKLVVRWYMFIANTLENKAC